jgi:hypothetical protein
MCIQSQPHPHLPASACRQAATTINPNNSSTSKPTCKMHAKGPAIRQKGAGRLAPYLCSAYRAPAGAMRAGSIQSSARQRGPAPATQAQGSQGSQQRSGCVPRPELSYPGAHSHRQQTSIRFQHVPTCGHGRPTRRPSSSHPLVHASAVGCRQRQALAPCCAGPLRAGCSGPSTTAHLGSIGCTVRPRRASPCTRTSPRQHACDASLGC